MMFIFSSGSCWLTTAKYNLLLTLLTLGEAMRLGEQGINRIRTGNTGKGYAPVIEASELPKNYIDDFDLLLARVKRDTLDYEFKIYKWNKNKLTWRIMNYPSPHSRITPYQVYKDVERAFALWSQMTPIDFKVSNRKEPDISIWFKSKAHGDNSPFDGRMGVRAHAFYPGSDPYGSLDGDIHLDDDEVFTHHKSVENGTNMMYVVAHEIGHSLGLYHSADPDSIMRPDYRDYIADNKLPLADARSIQQIYGKRPGMPDLPPPSTTPQPPPPFECKHTNYAAAVIRGSLLLFQGGRFWRFSTESLTSHLYTPSIGSPNRPYFKSLPNDIGAAFTLYNGTTVFMRGRNMWLYNLRERIPMKYPMRIRKEFGLPKNIDAAFHSPRRKTTYFFKGRKMWKFNHKTDKTAMRQRPSKEFNNLPRDLSAAYEDQDGNRYFLKEDRYWKYEYEDRKIAPGYPKLFPPNVC